MRIIAGLGKGRKLVSPPDVTRPTSDRAREGLFSSLISTLGTLKEKNFLDLFAGSGAVGVEALSRGALLVEAVESDPKSAKVCEQNFNLIAGLESIGKFAVYNQTCFEFLNHSVNKSYGIIFLDPPYDLFGDCYWSGDLGFQDSYKSVGSLFTSHFWIYRFTTYRCINSWRR